MMTLEVALRLGRVSNVPTVTSNVLAAITLAASSSGVHVGGPTIVCICLAMTLLYVAGMFLNDAFDHAIDAVERPERPIPSGQVTAADVYAAGFFLLALGVLVIVGLVVATDAGWPAIGSALVLAALIVVYDAYHKHNPLAPIVMALCRVGVYTTAALASGAALTSELWIGCGSLLAYLIGLSFIAQHENRQALGRWWPVLMLTAPFAIAAPLGAGPWAFALFGMFAAWVFRCVRHVHERDIKAGVSGLIAGIALHDALFIACAGTPKLAIVAVTAFLLTTRWQRRVPGT